jgi:hypothetical protein
MQIRRFNIKEKKNILKEVAGHIATGNERLTPCPFFIKTVPM